MRHFNVINLGKFKEEREIRRAEDSYKLYLKSLGNTQLEIEVNALLEEYSGDNYGKDFFSKGQLILKEITSRAHHSVKKKIELLTSDTLNLL